MCYIDWLLIRAQLRQLINSKIQKNREYVEGILHTCRYKYYSLLIQHQDKFYFVSGSDESVKFCLSFDSTRFDHQVAFSGPGIPKHSLEKFGSLNGDLKALKSQEIKLLIFIHTDSEGKRNLPKA